MQHDLNIDPKDYMNIIYEDKSYAIHIAIFGVILIIFVVYPYMIFVLRHRDDDYTKTIAELINSNDIAVRFKWVP